MPLLEIWAPLRDLPKFQLYLLEKIYVIFLPSGILQTDKIKIKNKKGEILHLYTRLECRRFLKSHLFLVLYSHIKLFLNLG